MLTSPSELLYVNWTFGGVKIKFVLDSMAWSTLTDENMEICKK